MRRLNIGQISLPYEIRWSPDRKSIGLSLSNSSELTVNAPSSAALDEIEATLERKKPWLLRKLRAVDSQEEAPGPKEYLSGEKLLYNGRQHRIEALEKPGLDEPEVEFADGRFRIEAPSYERDADRVEAVRGALKEWYWCVAEENLPERACKYARKLGLGSVEVLIYDSDTKWGESKGDSIRLNWRLMLAPTRIQDYIIVHELSHLKHPETPTHHSKPFWHTVGSLLPDYEERKEWLRLEGSILSL
ncbi:MAG: M48 family metallopeptidase [Candidatus Brocadiia bacterium]